MWKSISANTKGDNIATQVRVARRGARNGDACARRVATAVRAVFADADLREAEASDLKGILVGAGSRG